MLLSLMEGRRVYRSVRVHTLERESKREWQTWPKSFQPSMITMVGPSRPFLVISSVALYRFLSPLRGCWGWVVWFEFVSVGCWLLLKYMFVPMNDMAGREKRGREGREKRERGRVSAAVKVRERKGRRSCHRQNLSRRRDWVKLGLLWRPLSWSGAHWTRWKLGQTSDTHTPRPSLVATPADALVITVWSLWWR